MVVNYTYIQNKPLEEYQKILLKYSVLKSKQIGKVNIHCNKAFIPVITELELDIDGLFIIEPYHSIDYNTYWAASKIHTYDKRGIGEIHLDIDAVIKDTNITLDGKVDVTVAYFDEIIGKDKPTIFECHPKYEWPTYLVPDTDSFNMSFVFFTNKKLKDDYCNKAYSFMRGNKVVDKGWKYMVLAEQSMLTQLVLNNNFSYNYFNENNPEYYHLGGSKHFLTEENKIELIEKIKNRIKNEFSN